MASIELDTSDWPLVVTTPPQRSVTDEELEAFMVEHQTMRTERRGAFGEVLDLRGSVGLTPRQRKTITSAMEGMENSQGARCVAAAMVFDSALLRAMLTAFFWMRKPAYPVAVFPAVDEAKVWLRELLSASAVEPQRVAAAGAAPATGAAPSSVEDRLLRLQGLRDQGLMNDAEYEQQRQRILDDV